VPSAFEVALAAWLVAALSIACLLARSGRHDSAHVLASLALAGLVTTVATATGGIASFAAIWLIVVPVEASLSGSRRVVALVSMIALGAAGFLWLVSALDTATAAPMRVESMLSVLSVGSAMLYVAGLLLGSDARAASREREEGCYRLLARGMGDVITRHDRSGQVLFVSPAAPSLLGAKPSDLCGRGLFERVHVADRPAYLKALSDSATSGASPTVELRVRREALAAGAPPSFVWTEMRCWPLDRLPHAGADAECGVVSVLRDVSVRKDEERALEAARAAAERASGAKSRFLATVSHELRTPLNAIIGFSDMLCQEGTLMIDAKQRHDYAHLINESGHHLLSVVNGILDMSKIESGNFEIVPEPVAPASAIAECCELLALRAREAGIELDVRLASDLPAIVADKRALHQVMLNLLCNAVKFTDRGGKVTVTAGAQAPQIDGSHETDQESLQEAGQIVITVEDTGVGIGADDLARVGEPFFQARSSYDRRHDGTGLGLSIVKGLLALHGGRMEIESRVGEGTRVIVHLPFDCERGRRDVAAMRPVRVPPRRNETVRPELQADATVRKSA
jgi:cell cycle sensor histidine kinase DivJ